MTSDERYDAATKTLWVFRAYDDPFSLMDEQEVRTLSHAVRDGQWEGKPLSRVGVVFGHEDTAEYNHHALAFARLGTYIGTLDAPVAYDTDDEATFEAREDFGIKK